MRLIDVDVLEEELDKIPARSIENADRQAYVLIRLSKVFEIIKQLPSVEPSDEYRKGWHEGRKALREEMWEDGRDRLD